MPVKSLIYDERNFVQHNKETPTTKKGGFSFTPNIPLYMRWFGAEGNFQD